jgi:osmotically-inducible protein OsmY
MPTCLDLTRRFCCIALPLVLVACSSGREASSDSAAAAAGVADSAAGTTMQPARQPAASADARDDVVERALDADAGLQAFALDADDDDGRIVLKGRVQTAAQRDLAAQIAAREAAGVTVDNRIRVDAAARTGARPVDVDDIEDQVEDALEADSSLRALDLDVDEENGQLVLEGSATTAQRTAAEALAKRLAGTVTVVNRIKVQ